jgi:MFS family permease|uniref:Major facilitator superfamily (MFS) profile domain-containing protein n=1 Tax=Phaeodactylum tricornutum TaxID=2850 RepID=A0A8J9X6F7_PHATR
MINMQSAYLIVSQGYSEKQAGILFFVFGMSQFIFQTPAGYLYDSTERKVLWLSIAATVSMCLTLATAFFAQPMGANLTFMMLVKFGQGAATSFIPPGLNSITQGIVGSAGMTTQVSVNEMMNHTGTAIVVLTASLIGVLMYPSLKLLFVVSPIACIGVVYFLSRIRPEDIDHEAARGLDQEVKIPTDGIYRPPSTTTPTDAGDAPFGKAAVDDQPSFTLNSDWQSIAASAFSSGSNLKADSPLRVLRDPILLTFILVCFLFHTSNGTVLPLVMQTLALGSGRAGILMSGSCIIVAQLFMVISAKVCGEYSGKYGRKTLFLVGLFIVPIRCLILGVLLEFRGAGDASRLMEVAILSTQILDGIGAGVFGTMYILVTSDISGGTGRFSMTLGLTTAAMSIGGTVSGYLGESLAQDLGYKQAFFILMFMSLVPAVLYLVFMPETLAILAKSSSDPRGIASIKEGEQEKVGNYKELV